MLKSGEKVSRGRYQEINRDKPTSKELIHVAKSGNRLPPTSKKGEGFRRVR